MPDIAALQLTADSKQIRDATVALREMAPAATAAEKAAQRWGMTTGEASRSADDFSRRVQGTIKQLEFERQQLSRTAAEQAKYSALRRAGHAPAGPAAADHDVHEVRRPAGQALHLEGWLTEVPASDPCGRKEAVRYTFTCAKCGTSEVHNLPPDDCETPQKCECGSMAERDFMADWKTVQISTFGCRDHNRIPPEKRVLGSVTKEITKRDALRKERRFVEHVQERRKQLAGGQNSKAPIKQSHAIPADLFHGKIRETGDKKYWDDPKNVSRHNDWKVG